MTGISGLGGSGGLGGLSNIMGKNPLEGLLGAGGGNNSGGDKSKLLEGFVRMAANSKDEQTATAAKSVLGGLGLDATA